jgi:hypothetical protein
MFTNRRVMACDAQSPLDDRDFRRAFMQGVAVTVVEE